ncbi:propionate catabolism operon transcriptional regulator [Halanaerobium sp. DL-01]|uniref:sigma 54-interacting transcriptional regulator n=1 Tax=Halanaerobium sp. DL-01 TaxID=1653064 RepID=UPI000E148BB6|nr:sigma 54-interacting transcriptional regulator [Halanaerobium sp. DL-01]RCW78242.1 propionate catabolism operon transcriptional regulator [Halanaerobium sp. DL-01]
MSSKIAFMSYPRLTKLAKTILPKRFFKKVIVLEGSFDKTIKKVKELREKNVDVIVSGGSNAKILEKNFNNFSIVKINIAGFDLMNILNEAKKIDSKVAIITYKKKIDRLAKIEDIIDIQINNIIYNQRKQLNKIMKDLKDKDYKVVIGASLVCNEGEKNGLNSVFIYSENSLFNAFNRAIELDKTIKKEKHKNKVLKTIIEFSHSGIIAVNKKGEVQAYNTAAEDIFNKKKNEVLNKKVQKVIPNTRMDKVLKTGIQEKHKIQDIGDGKTIYTNRIPIYVDNDIMGVVATFQRTDFIERAEEKIRKKTYKKGLYAKYTFNDIIGETEIIRETIKKAKSYSKDESTILITGETGTGKELFAHSIHNSSKRRNNPFVAINCSALPEKLLESELFGYEKGAFTGASKDGKKGILELAHKGTVFLDEISEMPYKLQSRLLRVLQEREIMRLGGSEVIPIDIRIISATNKNIKSEVKKDKFRKDLFYRLNVLNLKIPPLRERKKDMYLLVKEIIKKKYPELLKEEFIKEISNEMKKYKWDGNIRQLENLLTRVCVLLKFNNYKVENIINNFEEIYNENIIENYSKNTKNEKKEIIKTLKNTGWNRTKAAKKLNISRTTLWRKMKSYNIKSETI